MLNRVRLRVMGLSYSPMQNGAFALLLAVDGDSPVRIPVVIGAPEAQSIASSIEGMNTPRPMTHDLFVSFARAFGIRLTEVYIYKFEDGIYSSELTFTDGERQIVLDSRTSDAVAIAMRTGVPIYTTQAIVAECGIELEEVHDDETDESDDAADSAIEEIGFDLENAVSDDPEADLRPGSGHLPADTEERLDDETLRRRMQFYAEHDDYESAMRIRSILDKRNKDKSDNKND